MYLCLSISILEDAIIINYQNFCGSKCRSILFDFYSMLFWIFFGIFFTDNAVTIFSRMDLWE